MLSGSTTRTFASVSMLLLLRCVPFFPVRIAVAPVETRRALFPQCLRLGRKDFRAPTVGTLLEAYPAHAEIVNTLYVLLPLPIVPDRTSLLNGTSGRQAYRSKITGEAAPVGSSPTPLSCDQLPSAPEHDGDDGAVQSACGKLHSVALHTS